MQDIILVISQLLILEPETSKANQYWWRELLEAASDADFFRAEACTCNYRVTGQLVARMSEWVHGYLDKDDYGAHHMDIP